MLTLAGIIFTCQFPKLSDQLGIFSHTVAAGVFLLPIGNVSLRLVSSGGVDVRVALVVVVF